MLVGRSTAVIVTGKAFGFVMVRTTSPLPPGYKRLLGADADAVIVKFVTDADWPSPEELDAKPTTQLVAP